MKYECELRIVDKNLHKKNLVVALGYICCHLFCLTHLDK